MLITELGFGIWGHLADPMGGKNAGTSSKQPTGGPLSRSCSRQCRTATRRLAARSSRQAVQRGDGTHGTETSTIDVALVNIVWQRKCESQAWIDAVSDSCSELSDQLQAEAENG